MSSRLRPEEIELLRTILSKRAPDLLPVVDSLGVVPLTNERREELRRAIADELCENELREDHEPTPRGVQLDDLIGRLGDQ
jgi:hypothetical protein